MEHMRAFYDIMLACGMLCPPYETWLAKSSENTELWPIQKSGQLVGGVLFRGHTVHIAIHPDWQGRWITPSLMRAYKTWTHDVPIYATPSVNNKAAIELAKRLGFEPRPEKSIQHQLLVKEPTCHPQSS